jgi:hypothetical protein
MEEFFTNNPMTLHSNISFPVSVAAPALKGSYKFGQFLQYAAGRKQPGCKIMVCA